MTRKCSFAGCKSGTASDRNRNKALGVRNKSFSKFPNKLQNIELRKKWEEALGREAKDNEVICELHFIKDDLQTKYEVPLRNGDSFTLERGKKSITSEAVPRALINVDTPTPHLPQGLHGEHSGLQNEGNVFSEIKRSDERVHETAISSAIASTVMETDYCSVIEKENMAVPENVAHPIQRPQRSPLTDVNYDLPPGNPLYSRSLSPDMCDARSDVPINEIPSEYDGVHQKIHSKRLSLLKELKSQLKKTVLPPGWRYTVLENSLLVAHYHDAPTTKQFLIFPDGGIQVFFNKVTVSVGGIHPGTTVKNILKNIDILRPLLICDGIGIENGFCSACEGYVQPTHSYIRYGHVRCAPCQRARQKILRLQSKHTKLSSKMKSKSEEFRNKTNNSRRKIRRLKTSIQKLRQQVEKAMKKCALARKEGIEAEIQNLCKEQQEAVRACFEAAKVSNRGRRYTRQWVYECLLMRIKSPKLYEHLRNHHILPVPHVDTLNRYLKHMGSAYGFNIETFNLLAKKAEQLDPAEKRGCLLIDEMKLTGTLKFDRESHKFHGFVNLGDHTPLHQKNTVGDHALVFMYQPFRGKWVQALACFLSKGCANSRVLKCSILECLALLENSGFACDVVTTDGATWNRSMWTQFGVAKEIDTDKGEIGIDHPFLPNRKLRFCSDFPHLIKNFRDSIIDTPEIMTPDGLVKLKHWEAVLEAESNPWGIKVAHNLTPTHLKPKYYQKMNVPLAFGLFAERVATAMVLYEDHPKLQDSFGTVQFILRIDRLIKIMMSREPKMALRPNSTEQTEIKDFLTFLKEWEVLSLDNGYKFLTQSTYYGLQVTLKATLEILDFLASQYDYEYLMVSRLNQDALERFFGLARGVCGSNDHPDSVIFGQMFRLMSTYSLVKPCKGSNVSGGEMLDTIINSTHLPDTENGQREWDKIIDSIVDNGEVYEMTNNIETGEQSYDDRQRTDTPEFLVGYMAGYMARKCRKWTECDTCIATIETSETTHDYHKMISLMTQGYLIYPTRNVVQLLKDIEDTILKVLGKEAVNCDSIFQILYALQERSLPLIGCSEHNKELTRTLLGFYVRTRAEFIGKIFNKQHSEEKEKTKQARKDSRL